MIPAFVLDLGQVGGAAHDLTAVAEFGAVARSAVGTGQQEGHVDFPWQCRVAGGLGNRYAMRNQFSTCWGRRARWKRARTLDHHLVKPTTSSGASMSSVIKRGMRMAMRTERDCVPRAMRG